MSPEQVDLIRASWPTIAASAEVLTGRFYVRLFEIDGSAARLFAGKDMIAQRARLAQALAVVVHALDDLDRLLPAVAELGRRHAGYGVEHHHFDSVGSALLLALDETLGPGFTEEVRQAWTEAYSLIASVMRRALLRPASLERAELAERG